MMVAIPKVTIVILNWNRWCDTVECLGSLVQVDYPSFDIIVVDNTSTDGSVERISEAFPHVLILRNTSNLGFAGGNNIRIEYAMKRGADYVLLLNNDTVVHPQFLSELVMAADSNAHIGITGPKIYFYAEPNRLWFAGPKRTWFYGRPLELGHRGFREIDYGQYDELEEVGFLTGCAMLLKRELIEAVGMFDLDYFAYFEDADLCLRAGEAGFKLLYVPHAKVWHKAKSSAMSIATSSPCSVYLGTRNRLLFMKKHGTKLGWAIFLPLFTFRALCGWIAYAVGRKPKVAIAIVRAVVDFFQGKLGAGSVKEL